MYSRESSTVWLYSVLFSKARWEDARLVALLFLAPATVGGTTAHYRSEPAGRDLGLATPTTDKALESGKLDPLLKLLTESMQTELRGKFKQALAKKKYRADDVEAGRAYVEAYVPFVRYVDRLYGVAKAPADWHHSESEGIRALKEQKH